VKDYAVGELRKGRDKVTGAVTSCSFAHDDVSCFIVDDDADADEGT
jgi:hypothetical protein